jgi:hypothetical protein
MTLEFTKAEKRLLELPLDDLNLTIRASNCLRSANIRTMRELLTYTAKELRENKMFGQRSILEIEEVLKNIGLSLRDGKTMKLELVKQIDPITEEVWYVVKLDTFIQYFTNESDAIKKYETLRQLKSKEKQEIVLKSEEINVSSNDVKTTYLN